VLFSHYLINIDHVISHNKQTITVTLEERNSMCFV